VIGVFGALALAFASGAFAGGPALRVGVTTDLAKQSDTALAQAEILRAKGAGFDTIRLTQGWLPGQTEPPGGDVGLLKNAVFAADANGLKVVIVVSHPGSRTTPLTEQARSEFAQFCAALAKALPTVRLFTIGNEPNLNGFWLPQFGPNGENVAAPAYLALLAAAYDALKAVSPRILVLGGALSPRGSDNPALSRHTHSPTQFIKDLGIAYRASGRATPVMDALSINPFPDNSSVSPATPHPNSTSIGVADYDKLVKLLGEAFDGTAQPGSKLPIYYGEFGVESLPPVEKLSLYEGTEPTTTKPVDEKKQAEYYRKAIELSFCQPNVAGLFLFLSADDAKRTGWQSGLYYADKTAKTSLAEVKKAARQSRGGVVAKCAGLQLTPTVDRFGAFGSNSRYGVNFRCSIDCTAEVELQRVTDRKVVGRITGRALGTVYSVVRLPKLKLARGSYRFNVSFYAPVNRGTTVVRSTRPFGVR
jgi:cellulase (glycosyl hydrolase family 5)